MSVRRTGVGHPETKPRPVEAVLRFHAERMREHRTVPPREGNEA
jgi:hypothetical protein